MKTCTAHDCERKLYCKGLCRRHYAFTLYIDEMCDNCGATFKTEPGRRKRYPHIYCSSACRDDHRAREWEASRPPRPVAIRTARPVLSVVARYLREPEATGLIVGGVCVVCGEWWLAIGSQLSSRTCSDKCSAEYRRAMRQDAKHRRRARMKAAYVEPVYRTRVYARDSHECQLCGEPVDLLQVAPHPLSPTIDHIIPIARGGTHEPSNVQTAHFICNSRKRDMFDELTTASNIMAKAA